MPLPRSWSFFAAGLDAGVQIRRLLLVARVASLSTPDYNRLKTLDGLRLFGNLNRLADFGGVTLNIRVGRLRP